MSDHVKTKCSQPAETLLLFHFWNALERTALDNYKKVRWEPKYKNQNLSLQASEHNL